MAASFNYLSEKDLVFGYKQIVWYYETQVRNNSTGFNKNRLKRFLDDNGIDISTSVDVEKSSNKVICQKRKSHFYFTQKEYDIPLILRMLRNSFAHSNVQKVKIGGYYFILFSNTYGGKKTFVGQISYSKFQDFVNALKSCRY